MTNGAQVRIESDGTPRGTHVLVDGKPLDTVTRVAWTIDGTTGRSIAVLHVDQVEALIVGQSEVHFTGRDSVEQDES